MRHRGVAALLLLLAAGCASAPSRTSAREAVPVPVAPPARPIDELVADLRSPSAATRATAAWALAGAVAPDRAVADALRAVCADPDDRVQEAAAWALGHVQPYRGSTSDLYDEPPRVLKMTRPTYPRDAFSKKVQGTVLLEILIAASGKVVHAEVRQSIPGLDEAALECVRQWSFEPARLKGKPVPTTAQAPVTFRIYK